MPRAATATKKKPIYGVHPGIAMVQKWVAELKQKSGRSLEEWLRLVRKSAPKDEQGRRDWLKQEHGMGTNTASWIAERSWESSFPFNRCGARWPRRCRPLRFRLSRP